MAGKRERWDSRGAFIMAAVGSAIGLGNVWRFPYIAGANGGGAFFIPYFVALLTAGVPLMMLEYALGVKFQGSAALSFKKWGRKWEWVGWWALMVGSMISFYYCAIMAWSWEYLYHSFGALFSGGLPWAGREADFLNDQVLLTTSGDGSLSVGRVVWPLLGGLALTWISIWWIIKNGVKRVGKIVMLTVPLPVVILVILFIRGVTLEGAGAGLDFYLNPEWELLKEPNVWLAAYGQIFFSLSLGFGILIAYASYLPKKSDIANNAYITSFANCATSFFAGLVVFSTAGFLAHQKGVGVEALIGDLGGPGLTFVTYPAAIAQINMPAVLLAVISILFFLMLLSLGIDSAFSIVEGMVTGLHDKFAANRGRIVTIMCVAGFLAGLIYITDAGQHYLTVVDHWMNDFGLPAVGLVECLVVGWFVRGRSLKDTIRKPNPLRVHINEVSDFRIGWWWELCIMVITPAILVTLLVMTFLKPFEGYPPWANYMGWGIFCGILVIGFFFMALGGASEERDEESES